MSRILLTTDDAVFEARVQAAFDGNLNGDLQRLDAAPLARMPGDRVVRALSEAAGNPEVVVLGPGLLTDQALELARRFDEERPEVTVVLVAKPTPDLWALALRAGVRDVLAPAAKADEIREVLERASSTATRRHQSFTDRGAPEERRARVIAVVAPKGGSGKTTVSTNLALGLAAIHPHEVVIVDADLQFGDVASALQLVPIHTIADAAAAAGISDAMALKVFLTAHAEQMYALCSPDTLVEAEQVAPQQITEMIEMLAGEFRHVVVDTAGGLHESALAVLDVATDIVVIGSTDVPSIRGLRKMLEALDQLGLVTARRHFVLNRADARVGMDTEDIEATLGTRIDVAVPSSRAVTLSINQGVPLLQSAPRSSVGRQLQAIVDRFAEQPAAQPRGLFTKKGSR